MSGEEPFVHILSKRRFEADGKNYELTPEVKQSALGEYGIRLMGEIRNREEFNRFFVFLEENYQITPTSTGTLISMPHETTPKRKTESIEVLLDSEKGDPDIPLLPEEDLSESKPKRRRRDSSQIRLRTELFDPRYK
ncbi:hypothetical protein GF358_01810 [Candidatus Woesearchaeota archaeon]|nr:hypothetical protein [Candidatus Woesearchaeota archaeon]